MKMWVFIKEITAGALILILFSLMSVAANAQSAKKPARYKTSIISVVANQNAPLTLKFDGIDLAAFEKSNPENVKRDIHSRVRSVAKRAGVRATPAEIDRATNKIIKLLRSKYVRSELVKNSNARITISVDLTFQPLTTEATFKF